ncbi:hypothetical protein PDIG_77260 [Penicillium digitatum PHI26]|uniref:Uncharacterized protein n=2 Tax=Penicillium digitatum TaxID=36651 RepID=K9FBE6_PEND2|nr:hypothetical protein PDIP_04380 [Penicillium digitatum Pd1]EKV06529.1 hypothetical protein PDIG_77260 [Penicillium digitatum PHI26]EKV21696.1 hypothetical protein PDIP_04380 [Penicillium digitatum Pd1]
MSSSGRAPLRWWFAMLNLQRQSYVSWHRDRIREELCERRIAESCWQKRSETADVLFSITRARYDGFSIRNPSCLSGIHSSPIYMYMLAKYTSRWSFFKVAAFFCNARHWNLVNEVVNPSKDHKLREVASRHEIDQKDFHRVSCRLRRIWPLLP